MKSCDYCKKEISYHEQYCCEDCERKALSFYSFREKYTKIFSVLCIVGVFSMPVGFFICGFSQRIGLLILAAAATLLGITMTALPFPVENMISSMKIKKAVSVARYIGIVLLAVGVVALALVLALVK